MRTRKAFYNAMAALLYEAIAIVSALILPRLILVNFGSETNGITSSITQFISYISLLTAGIGGVTKAALYKPLAEGDTIKISGVTRATEIFMRKVAFIFSAGLITFAALYPLLVQSDFDWFFAFSLALILGFGTFARYFFGLPYQMLLEADQRGYISSLLRSILTVLSTIIASVLILSGSEIRVVQLCSVLIFCIRPVLTNLYAKRHYKIIRPSEPDNNAIRQRWDAFAHQIAGFVNNNTGIAILTIFTDLKEVSVYAVYFLIIRNIRTMTNNLIGLGVPAVLGNMMAKNEQKALEKGVSLYEYISNTLSVILCTCTALLVTSFVAVYTKGVYDVDYYRPLFAYFACAAQFFFIIRTPYQALVEAAGHFKQTRNGAVLEACINIAVSVVLVNKIGLAGVAIGSFCAMTYRTGRFAFYASKNILNRSFRVAVRKVLLTVINAFAIIAVSQLIPDMQEITYLSWLLYALQVLGTAIGITLVFTAVFYREDAKSLLSKVKILVKRNP